MSQPRSLSGLAAPLFEKLIDLTPNSPEDDQDLIFQTRDAASRSIVREVSRLVDTRLPWVDEAEAALPAPRYGGGAPVDREQTTLRFGIPDLTHLCIRNTADRRVIERMVLDAIRAFEPRLEEPAVSVIMSAGSEGGQLEISGNVRLGRSLEPLAFTVEMGVKLEGETRRKLAVAAAKNNRRGTP